MNLLIEGNRVKTTSDYDVRMIRALPKLEGMKRWASGKVFTFENTPYNIEVWKSVFPFAEVKGMTGATAPREATSGSSAPDEA